MDNENMSVTEEVNTLPVEAKEKRRYFAKTGWKITLVGVAIQLVELIISFILIKVFHVDLVKKDVWVQFPIIFFGVNCVGFPLFYLLTAKSEKTLPEKRKLKFGWFVLLVFFCFFLTMAGNYIGMITNHIILSPFGINANAGNALSTLMSGDSALSIILAIIVAGIGAPIFEELIFRKLFMDHILKYGAGAAILLSGLFFGLYHGNFGQFFYAFAIGIVFAYVYAYTGNIKYTIFLHMSINLYSSLFILPVMANIDKEFLAGIRQALALLDTGDVQGYFNAATPIVENNPGALLMCFLLIIVIAFEYSMATAGFFIWPFFVKRFIGIRKSLNMGEKGTKRAAVFNWGSMLFIIMGILVFVYYYTNLILPVIVNRLR